ncbi:unnamed protein product [Bursaphelenchus okinawaensis]|uniref:Major facilitator superfamily (MFS) profile domain-containing protein n=1 Tax=Bursaphelenchus okinawaensis TaxID=465554 RepID=A0A811JUK0_9BILA|nr:unnamed protein product [Bursaphelenchus okinawaensis]CAG9084246.1 unnamed protein product [Bursaphelenchus okinawaensis]
MTADTFQYSADADPVLRMSEENVRRTSIAFAQKAIQLPGENDSTLIFRHKTRWLIILMSTLGLTLVMANSLVFNFTVICMVEPGEEYLLLNETAPGAVQPDFIYSDLERSWLFSAIAIGTLLGTLPITYLTSRYGIRLTFSVYGLISAGATLLSPLCVSIGMPFVFAMRVLQGVGVSTSWPVMGAIVAEWSSLAQSGMAVALLSCHLQLGAVVTMPLSGTLCESAVGWQGAFYVQGVATVLVVALFYWFYRDTAAEHRHVSQKELKQIQEGKIVRVLEEDEYEPIPYKRIFTDTCIIGILCSCFGGNFGFQTFFQYGPVYLNKVLKFDVTNTGFAAAVPYLLAILVKFIAGPLSDNIPGIGAKARVILFASVSQFCMAGCFLGLALMPIELSAWAQLFYTSAIIFSGLNCVGVIKSTQLVSGRFVHFLMAINGFSNSAIVLALPGIVTLFAPNNSKEEWSRLFIFVCVLVFIVTIVFDATAQVTPRSWAGGDSKRKPNTVAPYESENKFEIEADALGDTEAVERVLRRKRASIASRTFSETGRRLSILSLPRGYKAI